MSPDPAFDDITWIVLTNAQGDLCLWVSCRPVPAGWRETGPEGDVDTCRAWVDAHWTAMRPGARG